MGEAMDDKMDYGGRKVSIVLPTYNRANLLGRAIESILGQSWQAFELIVVDDGSTDHTPEVVGAYEDERIRYIKLDKNYGAAHARNVGIDNAKYSYIAFHDSDDVWCEGKLEKQMRLLATREQAGMVYGYCKYHGLAGETDYFPRREIAGEKKRGFIYPTMLEENLIGMPSLVVRRECIDKAGLFREDFQSLEDYEWFLRLSRVCEAEFIDEILVNVYAQEESVNRNLSANFSARCMLIGMYKHEMVKYGVLESVIQEFLGEANYLGCQEEVAAALCQVLGIPDEVQDGR